MTELEAIKDDIKEIKDNHLHHIYQVITEIKVNQKWLMGFYIISTTTIVGGLVKLLFFS